MGKKSRYSAVACNYGIATKCKGFVNSATMKEPNMCRPCWQSKHAASLNAVKNRWSVRGLKKKLMKIPIRKWTDYVEKIHNNSYDKKKGEKSEKARYHRRN